MWGRLVPLGGGMGMSGFTVLTVCTGNVHRSPLAAVLLERWASWYLPAALASHVSVGSAGTRPPIGAPIGDIAGLMAASLGGDPRHHRARRLTDELVADADLVLAASHTHRDDLLSRVPSAMRRTFTFREAGRTAELLGPRAAARTVADLRHAVADLAANRVPPPSSGEDDVIDPQGLPRTAYLQMAREEVPALAALASVLFGMPTGDLVAYRTAASDPVRLGLHRH